jgi:hypothetical protein
LLSATDLNGDGKLDLVVTQPGTNNVSVLMGNGDGTFTSLADFDLGSSYPNGLATGDLNGDGKPDLIVTVDDENKGMGIVVALGNGDGTFQSPQLLTSSTSSSTAFPYPGEVKASDLNHDGKLDLVYVNGDFGTMGVMYGNGDGTFLSPVEFPVGGAPSSLLALDVNNDGAIDVVVGNGDFSGITVLLNSGGAQTAVSSSLNPSITSDTVTFTATVTALRGVGTMPSGSVTFQDGSTVLGTVPLSNGTAALAVSNLSAGTHVITATYSGDSSFQSSVSSLLQTVNPAPPPSPYYTLSADPTSATITHAQSVTFKITATPVNGFAGTVNFSCGSLPSWLSCRFNPSSVAISGQPGRVNLVLQASSVQASLNPATPFPTQLPLWASFTGSVFGLITLEGVSQRKRRQQLTARHWRCIALLFLLLVGVVLLSSCAGGTGIAPHAGKGIPPGTYTISVTATSGALQQTLPLTLIVQ